MVKKFRYIEPDGKESESLAPESADFVSTGPSPDSPVKTGPDGLIDTSLLPSPITDRLTTKRICSEPISALKLVCRESSTNVLLADNSVAIKARVLGLALQSGNIGDEIDILLFGLETDPFFNFALQDPLFLGSLGEIIDVAPTVGYSVTVATSEGMGAIFLNIDEPTLIVI